MEKHPFVIDISNMTVANFFKLLLSEDLKVGRDCKMTVKESEVGINFSSDLSLGEFTDKNYKVLLGLDRICDDSLNSDKNYQVLIKIYQWRKKIRFSSG